MGQRNTTEDDITNEVLQRFAQTPDPRLRQIMLSLIGHLHAFVKEVNLTEAEWFQAIEVLTKAGHMSDDKRQEFILFSDTLGRRWWLTCGAIQNPTARPNRRCSARFTGSTRPRCRQAATLPISTE